jgi:hypothetical protein
MHHCHLVEHEDHDMMRPVVVMPLGLPRGATRGHGTYGAARPPKA